MTSGPGRRAHIVAASALALAAGSAAAQPRGFSGHYLNLWTRAGASALTSPGGSGFQRLRGMWRGTLGPARWDVAYEHTLALAEEGALGAQVFTAAGSTGGGDWLPLAGDLHNDDGLHWRQRVDRLSATFDLGADTELTVGRQPISWATTLFLTPGDPFAPFDPSDPFREYRAGVDAVRLRHYRGAFTQFELVARPAAFDVPGSAAGGGGGDAGTITLLARAATSVRGWDLSAWGGVLHDEFAAAAGASGSLGLWALRAEAVLREVDNGLAVRATAGLDRSFGLAGRDLYVVIEVQYDELGAAEPDDIVRVAASRAYAQGEMQALGRDVAAVQLSLQLHPLVSASSIFLASLGDGSVLAGPGLSYSVTEGVAFRAGAYAGAGEEASLDREGLRFGSEYGTVPVIVFTSVSVVF